MQLLKRDIKRLFVNAELMLDLKGDHPFIVPIDDQFLQEEVINKLLPRLNPIRANELIRAYRGLLSGEDFDTIFQNAFKTVEEIARELTGNMNFMFNKSNLKKCFPDLHPTTHETIILLQGHRGDKAGHGKKAPEAHEMRYLLCLLCNLALLMVDYKEK